MTSEESVEVGNILEGTVTRITAFGAFVQLPGGKTGLVHISEVAEAYVREVTDFLAEQQQVRVKVVSIDPTGKIALSIKQAELGYRPGQRSSRGPRFGAQSFEDKMAKFLKDSEDKKIDLKRIDGKRGGRGGR